ncbi:oxidoreductase [Cnuibacter physcomitrellae]|uniref:Oxidoreductase n=1 Tax=Cnuibacter physcomitrellae TaxID=1619308 RepID=A0A1X9LLL2_9MICO|nr:Gfo/Idh/MocA family oxidoreductase [Cnuibacter physcomitrellae]ARJ06064.1 oxidoreductase [Cnuibacter physcomitrellae]MCS5496172.1 Gfo/Idh/MocA family oxidoreductase [Cnuibacter physcomitrellae]GGI37136.1 oxidoreductase [Cnuibacter physcomitrellae]
MSDSIRWGILGTGGIARTFTTDLRAAGLEVAAVGSRSTESAEAFAAEFDVPRAHGSYEELAADPDVDVVYVASPHPFHAEHALMMIAAGKHVLIEKAFTVNAAQAERIAEAAREAGVAVIEAMWTRFLPHMVRIREIIAAGTLGDVRTVLAEHDQDLPDDPAHRVNDLALGGGALLDLGIYPVSFAIDMLGLPTRILAHSTMSATGADRQTAIIFEHEGGRQSVSHSALDAAGRVGAQVIGTDARIEIDPWWYGATGFRVVAPGGEVLEEYTDTVESRGMQYEALEMERVIRAGEHTSPLMPIEQSVAIMHVLDRIREQIGLVYPGEQGSVS